MKTIQDILQEIIQENSPSFKPFSKVRTDNYSSKMWISPKGELINLQMRHASFVETQKQRPEFKGKSFRKGENIRLDAIDAGWFRVNYEINWNNLIIEGLEKYFTSKIKDAIFMLVAENLKSIEKMEIHLLNERYKTIKSGEVDFSSMRQKDKLDHIPLVSESVRKQRGG